MRQHKQSLLEFQAQLAERLRATDRSETASKLGLGVGGQTWLTELSEIVEVVSEARIVPVPWAKAWFLGLANVRGVIYGCTDLAGFMGVDTTGERSGGRLLIVHPRYGVNAALHVESTLGLHNTAQMQQQACPAAAPPWIKAIWRDAEGRNWAELDVGKLVTDARFLDAGRDRQTMRVAMS